MRLGTDGKYLEEETQHIVSVNMKEDGWRHLAGSTGEEASPVSRKEFLVLLADTDRLLIRASYNIKQTEMTYVYCFIREQLTCDYCFIHE